MERARLLVGLASLTLVATSATAQAQPAEPLPPPVEPAPPPLPPAQDPLAQPPTSPSPAPPPTTPPADPRPRYQAPPPRYEAEPIPSEPVDAPKPMSEGRAIVVAWNTGFQWGLAPGVIFSGGQASFALGLRFGYGFDTDSVILVPGVRLAGYFTDPGVYLGMPVMKLVYPIDRFAPFVEGGGGIGYISSSPSQTGAALMGGGGFMIHFTMKFALGVEANYTAITGTGFHGFGVGPIIAFAF